jgi:hypothetical protein
MDEKTEKALAELKEKYPKYTRNITLAASYLESMSGQAKKEFGEIYKSKEEEKGGSDGEPNDDDGKERKVWGIFARGQGDPEEEEGG